MPTLPPPLQLNSAAYQPGENDEWSLKLDWIPLQQPCGTSYYVQMQLFDSAELTSTVGSTVTTTLPNALSGVWSARDAGATLDSATGYWIAVRAVNQQTNPTSIGAWTYPLPVLYRSPPKLGGVRYDGTGLDVVWAAPAGVNTISTYLAFVRDAGGVVLATLDANGQGYPAGKMNDGRYVRFALESAPLQLAVTPLSLALAPAWRDPNTGATSYGPADQSALFTAQPVVASAIYAGGTTQQALSYTVAAVNRDDPPDQPPTFLAALFADGTPVWEGALETQYPQQRGNPQGTLTLPDRIPFFADDPGIPPGMVLTLALARAGDVSVGPFGPRAALPSWPPEITYLEYVPGSRPSLAVEVAYAAGAPLQGAARIEVRTGGRLAAAGQVVGRRGSVPVPGLEAGTAYVVTASAVAGQSQGPPSAGVDLLMAAPTLTGATLDGRVVRASWQPATSAAYPGLTGFHLSVTSGGVEVAGVTVNDSAAAIQLPAGGESLAVEVRMVGGVARGPSSAALPLVGSVPVSVLALTDPVTGLTTLTWPPVENAYRYELEFLLNHAQTGEPVWVSAPTYRIPDALTPNAVQSVRGAVQVQTAGMYSTGPFSPEYVLPTAQPAGVAVEWAGRAATVSWQSAPGATGYVVSLLAADAKVPAAQARAGAADTSAVLDLSPGDLGGTYSVVVQALAGENSGPPTTPVPLFAPGYAVSTDDLTVQAPSIYPVASVAGGAWSITLYLPDLGMPLGAGTVEVGPFTLSNRHGQPQAGLYPFQLSIPRDSPAWEFDTSPVRADLQASYVSFLKAAEVGGARPTGIAILQEVISRVMPQTFQETLYYAYGMDLAAGVVDLRPGMVLRVATAGWLTPPGTPVPQYLSGYAASGVVDYEVGSYSWGSAWRVGVDAFVAQLVAGGAMTVTPPAQSVNQQQQQGAADAADLFSAGFLQPFYRLFVPSALASASEAGSAYTPDDFVIAASPTYGTLCSAVPYPSAGGAVAWFRGRAVLRPCIRVWVNGVPQVVPVGTTAGNLLDAAAQRVSAGARLPAGMRMFRGLGRAVLDPDSGLPAGLTYPVRLGWSTIPSYAAGMDSLSLPLLHGDRLTLPC